MTAKRAQGLRAPVLDFQITAEHIARAMRRDSGHCMIADALREAYPGAEYVSVDLASIRFTDLTAGLRYVYFTPRNAQDALVNWDAGIEVSPFRLRQSAAQITTTAGTRRKRAEANAGTGSPRKRAEDGKRAGAGPKRMTYSSNGAVPVVVGGRELPQPPQARTGRRREFGLRAYIR